MSDQERGLSIRELVLEIRQDIKEIKSHLSTVPNRKEVYGVMVALITLGLTVWSALV